MYDMIMWPLSNRRLPTFYSVIDFFFNLAKLLSVQKFYITS